MIEVRGFNGKLNLDDNPYRLPNGDYSDALNITRDAQGTGQDEVVSNVVGNTEVYYQFEEDTTSKVIGNYADKVRNRQYNFVWNSGGYHEITYYDATANVIVKVIKNLTDTGDVNVLNFDIDYKINHIDIIYRDEDGDLLYWTDGLNPPRKVNVKTATTGGYGTIVSSYIDVAKEPPSAPPYCIYEDDETVTTNNLNGKLFKFKYRFVFDDLEKSVTSAQSEVPLPYNAISNQTLGDATKNADIFIAFQTGAANVTRIELLGSESLGTTWSDFALINVFDKSELGLNDNDVTYYRFYNNEAYNQISIIESIQPFDLVPQKAYTQSLPNGNVLDYGAITEGYNLVVPYFITTPLTNFSSAKLINNLLLLAYQEEAPAFGSGNIKIILAGTVKYGDLIEVNAVISGTLTTIDATANSSPFVDDIATMLDKLRLSAIAHGYTIVSVSDNELIINQVNTSLYNVNITTYPDVLYYSPRLAYDWTSKYSYGVVYFDEKGRTNGVTTSKQCTFSTKPYTASETPPFTEKRPYLPNQQFSIYSRPPEWAEYFQLVRTKNLTKSSFLYWVSNGTFQDNTANELGYQYAYISIATLTQYIIDHPEVKTIGYEFAPGDRIKFVLLYNGDGLTTEYGVDHDYEILDSLTDPFINGIKIVGQILKIYLPQGTGPFFGFGPAFPNYLIELYTPAPNFSNSTNLYYEFGEKYTIGNSGTNLAYHQGMIQNQTDNLSQPAIFNLISGDAYFRYRLFSLGAYTKWGLFPIFDPVVYLGTLWFNASIITNLSTSLLYTVNNTTTSSDYQITITNPANPQPSFRTKGHIVFTSSTNSYSPVFRNLRIQYYNTSFAFISEDLITDIPPFYANQPISLDWDKTITPVPNTKYIRFIMSLSGATNVVFEEGAYLIVQDPSTIYQGIIDPNFSDNYDSSASPNGRAWSYDPNAAQEFNPTLIRFGGEYQAGTTVNQTNRFYEENFDLYDRSRGSIKKMFIEGRNQYIFQQFDVGVVTVLTQIVKDTAGNPLSAQSDRLLNKIVYPYVGGYGIGDMPESFAYGKSSKYFIDSNKGVVCRLAANGITPLSIVYKTNAFFVEKIGTYKNDLPIPPLLGKPVIYGAFDAYTNKYMIAMEGIIDITDPLVPIQVQNAYTISFLESRDNKEGFESFLDYYPENMGALNNLFITYTGGQLWKHDNPVFCNFYNAQKSASITTIFNDAPLDKKSFLSIMETANTVWYCYNIESQLNSYGTVPQVTYINAARFALLEGQYYSAILRDANSPGGIINGDTIHGNYLKIVFKIDSANTFSYLNTVSLNYNNSPLNLR